MNLNKVPYKVEVPHIIVPLPALQILQILYISMAEAETIDCYKKQRSLITDTTFK